MKKSTKILIEKKKRHKGGNLISCVGSMKVEYLTTDMSALTYNMEKREKSFSPITDINITDCNDWYILSFSNNNQIILPHNQPLAVIENSHYTCIPAENLTVGMSALQIMYAGYHGATSLRGESHYDLYGEVIASKMRSAISKASSQKYDQRFKHSTPEIEKKKRTGHSKGKTYKQMFGTSNADRLARMRSSTMFRLRSEDDKYITAGPEALKHLWTENRPEMLQNTRKAGAASQRASQQQTKTRPEREVHEILDRIAPEFVYNGCVDNPLQIGYRTPDFVWPDAKKAIEVFGCYWHACPICERGPVTTPPGNDTVYTDYNDNDYDVLVIWEHELRDRIALEAKITAFAFNPDSEIVRIVSVGHDDRERDDYRICVNGNLFINGILVCE